MDISYEAYQKLYSLLVNKIFNDELTDVQKAKLSQGALDYNLWYVEGESKGGKVNYFKRIFSELARNHLYKKYGEYDPAKPPLGTLKDHIAIAIFEYLGLKLSHQNQVEAKKSPKSKADLLYKEFVKNYLEETNSSVFENNSKGGVFPDAPYVMDFGHRKSNDGPTVTYMRSIFFDSVEEEIFFNVPLIERFIREYITALSEHRYLTAIHFWNRKISHEVWDGNPVAFSSQFFYSNSINDHAIAVWNVRIQQVGNDVFDPEHYAEIKDISEHEENFTLSNLFKATCDVYFEDMTVSPFDDLQKIFSSQANNSELSVENFGELIKKVNKSSFVPKNLTIEELLDPNIFEILKNKYQLSMEQINYLFPKHTHISRRNLFEFELKNTQRYHGGYDWSITKVSRIRL